MSHKMLGTLEQKVMNILWMAKKPLKPAEVLSGLSDKYAYTTIMPELKRMADKKILNRQLVGKAYVYTPISTKAGFAKNCLCSLFSGVVGSYGSLAISQFVDTLKNNPDDLALLQKYLHKLSK